MDPTTHGLMALAALALLCCMRRRRTGPESLSDDEIMNAKREQNAARWNGRAGK